MPRNLLSLTFAVGGYGAFLAVLAATYRQLPLRVASHFGVDGVANGWASRESYAWTLIIILTAVTLAIAGSAAIIRITPTNLVNLPHREYWLAPDRREATIGVVQRFGFIMAGLTSLLFLAIHLLTVAANESQPAVLSSAVWWLLGAFLAATGAMVFMLYKRFARVA
jgi:uncharacterized membrane protein